ncbi:MAG: hypothetical protein AAFY19_03905 [Pseudomonadota bacterium]
MTTGASSTSAQIPADAAPEAAGEDAGIASGGLPEGYEDIRANPQTQFEPIQLKELKPREPSWFDEWLRGVFEWLGEVFGPFGRFVAENWAVIQWVLIVSLVAFVLFLIARLIGPLADRQNAKAEALEEEPEWQPDTAESLALLEDADRLAEQGRFDEAAHLLLKRSVGQIAASRPDWVDPSSTARELAALPRLSDAARRAFGVISEAVERSLFALRQLSREDWETARAAYADFALARIDAGKTGAKSSR